MALALSLSAPHLLRDNQSVPMPTLLDRAPDARTRAIDATSTDPWGPSRSLMEELRAYTRTRDCADVLHVLHDALTARGPAWRRVLKALTTIAYCLREGSNEVALFATAHRSLISQLTYFEYLDTYRLDRGAAVREEARVVADMLQLGENSSPRGTLAGPSMRNTSSSRGPAAHAAALPQGAPHLWTWSSAAVFTGKAPEEDIEYPSQDSDRLAALINSVEFTNSDEDAWLNIYKLLFLLQNTLPTASDDDILHWMQHTHLLKRLARRPPSRALPAEDGVAPEVRRLAGELAGMLANGSSTKDVRRRARMF